MKILYFAWLRTRIGTTEEQVAPPLSVETVADLIAWLKDRGTPYAEALANDSLVKVAVNQDFATRETPVRPNDEVALFPPVTGG